VSLLFLGVAGLGLPVLQGWLFILMGIWLLAEDFPFFARLSARIKRGFSAFARA
jgi:uncharacterized membrane protein YbaN (DUF454 family)